MKGTFSRDQNQPEYAFPIVIGSFAQVMVGSLLWLSNSILIGLSKKQKCSLWKVQALIYATCVANVHLLPDKAWRNFEALVKNHEW